MEMRYISLREAKAFIAEHHRHHKPPQGWKFGLSAWKHEVMVGVATVGNPVARMLYNNGQTLEVTRCCTDGTKNACSFLYSAARREAKSRGYKRLITYTLASESGVSLIAAGWTMLYETKGGTWSRKDRPRTDKHPTVKKRLWEAYAL